MATTPANDPQRRTTSRPGHAPPPDAAESRSAPLPASRATTSPINGEHLHSLEWVDAAAVDSAVERAQQAFRSWRTVPAPGRGAVVKRLGELLTEHKRDLATLISLEVGKITSEALGEVQEMIDICDFAVGLSRQLYGRTMPSERPGHRLMETWHPLGVVGVISAFNFPVAVWSWNTAVALVCGDPVIWKPSEQAPLTAAASAALLDRALSEQGAPADVSQVLVGGAEVGQALVDHPGVALAERHRLDPHGPCGGSARRRAVRTLAAGAGREQRRRRRAVGRPGPGHPRHRVLGRRDGRPAVHHDASGDRPLQRRSTSWSRGCPGRMRGCPSATRWRPGRWSVH